MSNPGLALQKALFDKLSAILTVPVFDAVPAKTPYPYVTLDYEVSSNASPMSGKKRESRLFYLTVWSTYKGQAEVKRINGEIVAALNERPLPLEFGRAVSVRVEQSDAQRDADCVTYQGSITIRVITTH